MPRASAIMFCGSSAVGKSTALKGIEEERIEFQSIPLAARTEREKLGNPNWQDLLNDVNLAMEHQTFILNNFLKTIEETTRLGHYRYDAPTFIFERSPLDVLGYSYSFKCPFWFIEDQRTKLEKAFSRMKFYVNMMILYFPIDFSMPYAIEAARPPEQVRLACDDYVRGLVNYYRLHANSDVDVGWVETEHLREVANYGRIEDRPVFPEKRLLPDTWQDYVIKWVERIQSSVYSE